MKRESCDYCHGTNIVENCSRCGAPVCCDDCCALTTHEIDKAMKVVEARACPHGYVGADGWCPHGCPGWRSA